MRNPNTILRAAFFILTVMAGSASAQPNLTPFQPPKWSDKVVVTTSSSGTTDSADLLTTQSLYVDWCVINSGNQDVNTTFYVALSLDGAQLQQWQIPGLSQNSYEYVTGYPIGQLSAGSHTVEVVADATDVVPGDDEADNSYTKTINVAAVILPAPTAETPANGVTGQPAVPYFSWTSVSNASSYRVFVATSASDLPTSTTATNGGASVVIAAVAPTTNFSPTITLNPSTTYYWEVAAGNDGAWSAVQQFTTQATPTGVTIVPTFDSSITSDPQAATIEATINAAISVYRSVFSDQVTANFTFTEMSSGLGENDGEYDYIDYSDYRAALVAHATTADDATMLAHLPGGSSNPVNGNSQVSIKLPLARALGLDTGPTPGEVDATVYLNTSIMNLSSFTVDPSKYSLFSTVSHEMDEALGFGSALNGSNNGDPAPTDPVFPQDLLRYDGGGNRSFTTALNAVAYFSLDGTNDLAQFNQYQGGDFGDWYSYNAQVVPQVQDAFLNPGVNPVLGPAELRGLDAIGFTRVAATAPAAAAQLSGAVISGGNFQFTLSGSAGAKYVVQTSTDLITWTAVSTNTVGSGGTVTVTTAIGGTITGPGNLFFRAVAQ